MHMYDFKTTQEEGDLLKFVGQDEIQRIGKKTR